MYADDVQLYTSFKANEVSLCTSTINRDLDLISKWGDNNGLCINPMKTKLMTISKRPIIVHEEFYIKINNSDIVCVQTSRNLGLIFNSRLTWTNHINGTVGKVYGMLRNLWAVRISTPFQIRMLLAKSYLIPTLLYGCEVFANCDTADSRKLNVAFNNIARYVFNKKPRDRISQFAYQIFNISFDNLLKIKCLIMLHKIIYTKEPEHLFTRINFARSNRGMKLINPRINSLTSERQFFVYTIRLWNNLPSNIQTISNALTFKKELFELFK